MEGRRGKAEGCGGRGEMIEGEGGEGDRRAGRRMGEGRGEGAGGVEGESIR